MASASKRKSKDLQSFLISYIIDDGEDSAICEIDNDKKNDEPTYITLDNASADGDEDEGTTLTINSKSESKMKANFSVGNVGSYYVDQNGIFYVQKTKNRIEEVEVEPPGGTIFKKFTLPSIPKDNAAAATETNKKPNTRSIRKSCTQEDGRITYVFMLKSTDTVDLNEEDDDADDPIMRKQNADTTKSSTQKHKFVEFVVTKNDIGDAEVKGVIYACNYCDYSTYKSNALTKHVRAHLNDGEFICSVCERTFKTKASLINHMNAHMGHKPHDCKYCSMSFTTAGEVVRHTRYKHTGEKPHKCTECDYCSVELSKLRRHMRSHTGERPYQCPHCTYASPDTFKLKRHLRTHTGEKPYECDICHARFTQSNSLKSHRLIHSVGEKPVFQCEYCPTTCGRKTDLRAHVYYLHTSDKPIPCKRCTQELPDRWSYKMHLKTHIGEKSFKCEICPYAAASQRHLDSHMMVHKDEKPFACKSCEASFRQVALLKRHINLYHTTDYKPPEPKDKSHSCPHCNKRFRHNGNLMRHMEMHDPNSNTMKMKKELQAGRKTRVNADGTISQVENANISKSEKESSKEEEEEFFIIDDINVDENYEEQEEEESMKWNSDEGGVLKFEIDSEDMILRPITSKVPASSKTSSDIKTILIDENCDSVEMECDEEDSKVMFLRVIDCPDDESNEADNELKFTKTDDGEIMGDSCLSFKVTII